KDLILDDSLQDLELIQPSVLNVLQCKVLPGTQEGMGWTQPGLLITVSLIHTCIQTGESSKGWDSTGCFLQSFNSASAAVKINTAPGSDCVFQRCPVESSLTLFNSLIC
ncbi:hypothetical protein Y956_03927, partial [Nipponia nippon]